MVVVRDHAGSGGVAIDFHQNDAVHRGNATGCAANLDELTVVIWAGRVDIKLVEQQCGHGPDF
jgi:hypothetical protein